MSITAEIIQSSRLPSGVGSPQQEEPQSSKKIIRDLGLNVTTQRLLILDLILKGPDHFTAQEIFELVQKENDAVGFATVYRFLRLLTDHKYTTEVRMGGMPARYEWANRQHHDHLTCTTCRKIIEFENIEIEQLQERVARQFGFILKSHLLELYGLCPDCSRQLK